MKKLLKKIIPQPKILQRFYEGLHYVGLWGMNYGRSADLTESGEMNAVKRIQRFIKINEPILFDVGANVRDYSILLSKQFTNSTIHCFEPIQDTYRQLVENTQNTDRILTHKLGFGAVAENLEVSSNPNESSHTSLITYRANDDSNKLTETVQIVRIDDFCSSEKIQKIDFLKVDVEGYELAVLKGASGMIEKRKIDFIQFEFRGTMIDAGVFFRDIWDILNANYRIYRILKNDLYLIKNYNLSLEIFHFSNFIAISRDR